MWSLLPATAFIMTLLARSTPFHWKDWFANKASGGGESLCLNSKGNICSSDEMTLSGGMLRI